jgi:hypothetical protein
MPRFRSYREAILSARNSTEIVRVLNEAVSTLAPEELRVLPGDCREALVDRSAENIHAIAVTLLQCDLRHRGERDVGELIRQTAELYAWASVRVSQLEHTRPESST